MVAVDGGQVQAALVGLVAAGGLGWFTPMLIRAVPEPTPEPDPEPENQALPGAELEQDGAEQDEAEPPVEQPAKELYADIAGTPHLAPRAALLSAVAAALVGLRLGWDPLLLVLVPAFPVCVALSIVDLRTRLLPTRIVVPATLAALAGMGLVALATQDKDLIVRGLVGLVVLRSIFWLLWAIRSAGMGFGDVRLAALLGLLLAAVSWPSLLVGGYAGFLVFGVPGAVLALVRWDRRLLKQAYPFGPFMAIGALLGILAGNALWSHLAA